MPQFHGLWQKTGDSLVLDPGHCYDSKMSALHKQQSDLQFPQGDSSSGQGDICIHVHCIT